jgi:predicted TIM-barrel fold metal-dependent hydrolase
VTPFDHAYEHARAIVDSYAAQLRSELPANALLFDVHTHLGHDIDGMNGFYEELTEGLDRYGFSHAFVFCMDEYDREPAFTVPNDRTLAHAERAGGTLIPFARLDLTEGPLDEARRCLDLGAKGIKLHPRAQAFTLDDERLPPIFELAAERSAPILIHGGRGLPPIAEHLELLVQRFERVPLIIAHAGIAVTREALCHRGGLGVISSTPRSGQRRPLLTSSARSLRNRSSMRPTTRTAAELAPDGDSFGKGSRIRRIPSPGHDR